MWNRWWSNIFTGSISNTDCIIIPAGWVVATVTGPKDSMNAYGLKKCFLPKGQITKIEEAVDYFMKSCELSDGQRKHLGMLLDVLVVAKQK